MSSAQTLALVALLFAVGMIATFNRLVRLRNNLSLAWSSIEIQVKQKQDLLPELLGVAENFAREECEVAMQMLRSRGTTAAIAGVHQVAHSHSQTKQVVAGFLSITETYPDILDGEAVTSILKSLAASDAKIAFAKEYYNGAVSEYNTVLEMWPYGLIGKLCKFKKRDFFDAIEELAEPT